MELFSSENTSLTPKSQDSSSGQPSRSAQAKGTTKAPRHGGEMTNQDLGAGLSSQPVPVPPSGCYLIQEALS